MVTSPPLWLRGRLRDDVGISGALGFAPQGARSRSAVRFLHSIPRFSDDPPWVRIRADRAGIPWPLGVPNIPEFRNVVQARVFADETDAFRKPFCFQRLKGLNS
ncbi:hypothetical protein [Methylobacterium sp. V23]|uniref:hypothetical protein n=1 Tax=Methylobacterium sp. V23 TaxID=2044878 RepID=UPI0011B02842|nr:hypothetical protein [Methylobacterium sp. V23]